MRPNEMSGGIPAGLNGQPVLLDQPRAAREVQLLEAMFQCRKLLYTQIEGVEEALLFCSKEETAALEEARAWMKAKLEETGPAFARAMVKAAPLLREGAENVFAPLLRAVE